MGGSEKLGQHLQDGRKGCHFKDLLVMLNQQVGLWEILDCKLGSNSPLKTQQRRDWFHAHEKATKRTTQMQNRIRSYLSDNGVRLKKGTRLAQPNAAVETLLRQAKPWSVHQWQILEGMLMELRHADEQRRFWRSAIAQEVLGDPALLQIVRLCGVRDLIAFALGAIIGDINRFARPGSLVKYIGLDPAFDDSGQGQWHG